MTIPQASLTVVPAVFEARVRETAARWTSARVMERLIQRDASLWSHDPREQESIRSRLGWLSIIPAMESRVSEMTAFADEVRRAGFTHALLLGMGGSSLFPEVCRVVHGVAPGGLDLHALDTTDPTAITAAAARAPLERTLFIVSSKSGTTIETRSLARYFYEQVRGRIGELAGGQFIAITDENTPLAQEAARLKFRRVFAHGPTTGQDVGGRFSALIYFGLVPAAVMGFNVPRLLACARAMLEQAQSASPEDTASLMLAAALEEAARAGRDKVTLLASRRLAPFGAWLEQLLAESTGKHGHGLIPIVAEPVRDATFYGADRVFIELQRQGEEEVSLTGATSALAARGHPVIRLRGGDGDGLGAEAIRWWMATSIVAMGLQINPFDEPDVQASKDRTKALLDRYAREPRLPLSTSQATEGDGRVFGDWLKQVGAGDYVAVLSFLPRSASLDEALASLRDDLANATKAPTILSYGPRYLHSIGQLYKGGPASGAFLVLTADDPVDYPIPGEPYSFSVLKRAQAVGDYQALQERQRRVLMMHLGRSPEAGLSRIAARVRSHVT